MEPWQGATEAAVEQVRALVRRRASVSTTPVLVLDAGYDVTALPHALLTEPVSLLVRLRRGRCFSGPPPAVGARTGRPRRNGAEFRCDAPATWPAPTAAHTCEDAQYGTVTVEAWTGLHTVVRSPPDAPDLDRVWRSYFRRYDIEQTFRFLKPPLHWATPQIRAPEQADRRTWLAAAAYTPLRLARSAVTDRRLPWQRPRAPARRTPARAQRGFSTPLLAPGTPAAAPTPRGRSPGRPQGRLSGRAPRYPAVKKAA